MERSHVIHVVLLDHLARTLASLRRGRPIAVYVPEVCCDPLFPQVIEVSNGVAMLEPLV